MFLRYSVLYTRDKNTSSRLLILHNNLDKVVSRMNRLRLIFRALHVKATGECRVENAYLHHPTFMELLNTSSVLESFPVSHRPPVPIKPHLSTDPERLISPRLFSLIVWILSRFLTHYLTRLSLGFSRSPLRLSSFPCLSYLSD